MFGSGTHKQVSSPASANPYRWRRGPPSGLEHPRPVARRQYPFDVALKGGVYVIDHAVNDCAEGTHRAGMTSRLSSLFWTQTLPGWDTRSVSFVFATQEAR